MVNTSTLGVTVSEGGRMVMVSSFQQAVPYQFTTVGRLKDGVIWDDGYQNKRRFSLGKLGSF